MSRAYRITVKESETREIRGEDEICTTLELLEVLPPDQMAGLLKAELEANGFQEDNDGALSRKEGKLTVTVDPCSGEVSVKSEASENVTIEAKREATGYDDVGPNQSNTRAKVSQQLKEDIDRKAAREGERLQTKATEALEAALEELQPELGKIVNKVTRDALKTKAQQLGTVMEIAEDAESGSLTIKVEV